MKTLETLLEELPGMKFERYVSHPNVNGGKPLPLLSFKSKERGINTIEGWKESADRCNRRSFIKAHGREPVDMNDVYAWIERLTGRKVEVAEVSEIPDIPMDLLQPWDSDSKEVSPE